MDERLNGCLREIEELRRAIVDATPSSGDLDQVHPIHRWSAENLAHFVAMRGRDLRPLQDDLSSLGLSSLGRSEARVLSSVQAVSRALRALAGLQRAEDEHDDIEADAGAGGRILEERTRSLLGADPDGRTTRIMVTLPSESADDPAMIERFVAAGMDIARINCAHDDATTWSAMAHHVRSASSKHGREVRIMMDLAGPKLRTARMMPGPAVVKIKPRRDIFGNVLAPGRAVLVAIGTPLTERDDALAAIPVSAELWDVLRPGMKLTLRDSRGAKRTMLVVDVDTTSATVECERTTYVTSGMALECVHPSGGVGVVGDLPKAPGSLSLSAGNFVELVGGDVEGEPLTAGRVRVGCSLSEAVAATRRGDRVTFDDGRFVGVVEEVWSAGNGAPTAVVRITSTPVGGGKLKAEKGINLPDTDVPIAALTEKDHADLASVVQFADIVALSFVRSADDVLLLQQSLDALGGGDLGIVLKIETAQGFQSLPDILTTAMRSERVGVMIARGDLAVEMGYERLAEVQEEILWLCEAAHLPVIWATEVLDQLARTGRPSRSEITDAAMSERAECVMLNKGPHVVDAIVTLDDILHRMSDHMSKKRHLMRPLRAWAQPLVD